NLSGDHRNIAVHRPRSLGARLFIAATSVTSLSPPHKVQQVFELLTMFELLFDALYGFRPVQIGAIKELVSLAERTPDARRHAVSRKPDTVNLNHLRRYSIGQHERRNILVDLTHSTDHCEFADAAVLMDTHHSSEHHMVFDRYMPG